MHIIEQESFIPLNDVNKSNISSNMIPTTRFTNRVHPDSRNSPYHEANTSRQQNLRFSGAISDKKIMLDSKDSSRKSIIKGLRKSFIASDNNSDQSRKNRSNRRISIAKISENITKMTKNAMAEFSEAVKQTDFKSEYRKGLERAYNFLDLNSSQNPLIKLAKNFVFFNIQMIIFLMNFISIVSLIMVSSFRMNQLEESYESTLIIMELSLSVFFAIENILEIFFSYHGLISIVKLFFSANIIYNNLLIIDILVTFSCNHDFERISNLFIVITFLRSLKVVKLRKIFEYNMKEIRKILSQHTQKLTVALANEEDDLNSVIDSGLDIMVFIFIEATALICLNEFLDYNGFLQGSTFGYITACYYTIVSLTSIGYGDIAPIQWESRLFMICTLIINVTLLSIYIGSLTEKIRKLSPWVKNFYFKGHVVIIGEIPVSFLRFFIKEMHANDIVHRDLNTTKENSIKFIIVGKDNPSKELEHWILKYSYEEKDTEVEYLKANVTESLWFKQANLIAARHLFAFSLNLKESETEAFEKDKQLSFNIQTIINSYPKLPITLVLSTIYEENINKDSLWKNVTTIPFRLMNDFIMANSIENQGFNTWLVHLLTLRDKIMPNFKKEREYDKLNEYAADMTQEIYPIKLPSMFVGKSFIEAAKIIYFSSIDFMDYFLFKPEDPIEKGKLPASQLKQFALQLLAVSTTKGNENCKIMINPINYIITEHDIGYVIAEDQKLAQQVSIMNTSSASYATYTRNVNLFQKILDQKIMKIPETVSMMFQTSETFYNNWKIDSKKYFKNNPKKTNITTTTTSSPKLKNSNNNNDVPDIFNLYLDNSPKGVFKNHLIIKGNIVELSNIAYIIRFYSQRPIILFTESINNLGNWMKIREKYNNVFLVIGSSFNIKHLQQIDPKRAYRILILTNTKNDYIQDSENIVFTRILSDFFEIPNFLVELMDENNMCYLSSKPKITLDGELDYFFWPYFVRGNVHFSSLIMSFVARSLYNSNWISFLKQLAKPNVYFRHEISAGTIVENGSIYSIIINEDILKEIPIYGQLQYYLMNSTPPIMAIALLKERKQNSKLYRQRLNSSEIGGFTSNSQESTYKLLIANHILKTMDDIYGSSFLLTNPSFLTSLEIGDRVLVIGTTNVIREKTRTDKTFKTFKAVYRIQSYLTQSNSAGLRSNSNISNQRDEKNRILKHFKEKREIWKNLDGRNDFKENLIMMIEGTNCVLRESLEHYEEFVE